MSAILSAFRGLDGSEMGRNGHSVFVWVLRILRNVADTLLTRLALTVRDFLT